MSRIALAFAFLPVTALAADAPEFAKDVQPVLTKYCAGCHNAADAAENGKFALHDFGSLMKGGEHGAVLVPGKLDESRVVKLVERRAEPAMPPDGEPAPTAEEVAVLKAWIAAGAKGPAGDAAPMLNVPKIDPTGPVRRPVHAAAWSPDGSTLAVGRYRAVELLGADLKPRTTIDGLTGQVTVVAFLPDGRLFAAGGEPGLAGEAGVWDVATGQAVWRRPTHRDAVTSGAVSPDGKLLATGSYDQTIAVYDTSTGETKASLTGHNSAIFGLAFHPTKPILASASADRTVKLWDTTTGERLDTLIEPTKEQVAVAFSPDGGRLFAAGADSRVRVWSVADGKAGTNEILFSHFAHEGPIVALAFSRDGRLLVTASEDKTVKVWDAGSLTQVVPPAAQPDWVATLAVTPTAPQVALGRLDGGIDVMSLPIDPGTGAAGSEASPAVAERPVAASPEEPMPAPVAEAEPNDDPKAASTLTLPGVVTGVLDKAEGKREDADCFRLAARAGETWIFETNAGRAGSPADTKIDLLAADGSPVERLRLRAVRNSAINFRGISAASPGVRVDYWEEMELNEYMYLSGEVCRIFRMPQGPDSETQFYSVSGQRRTYFDTTPVAHALFEPVYIVEPHPPGSELPANGLPVFSLPYENDDDSERKLGRDSKVTFTAPADGEYVIRVRDARGFAGADYKYTLSARRPKPDFAVSVAENEPTVPAGSGQRLTVRVDRADGFEGPVRVAFSNLPAGLSVSSPVVIEAGHSEAKAVLSAAPDATTPPEEAWKAVTAEATGHVAGGLVTKAVAPPQKVTIGPKPPVVVTLAPEGGGEIVIRPGQSVTAMLRMERNGYDNELNFDVENLPHGVIVDNIGLNGVLIRQNENERQIVLTCAKWVPATTRLIFAVGKGQGDQASRPVTLRVVRDEPIAQAGG